MMSVGNPGGCVKDLQRPLCQGSVRAVPPRRPPQDFPLTQTRQRCTLNQDERQQGASREGPDEWEDRAP